jgi:hypothetical protein
MALGHEVTVDGILNEWLASDRIDDQQATGYRVNGTSGANNFYLSLTAPTAIGANTTVWLNTDRNATTGYQVFGSGVGAEFQIEFNADNTVSLLDKAGLVVAGNLTSPMTKSPFPAAAVEIRRRSP